MSAIELCDFLYSFKIVFLSWVHSQRGADLGIHALKSYSRKTLNLYRFPFYSHPADESRLDNWLLSQFIQNGELYANLFHEFLYNLIGKKLVSHCVHLDRIIVELASSTIVWLWVVVSQSFTRLRDNICKIYWWYD